MQTDTPFNPQQIDELKEAAKSYSKTDYGNYLNKLIENAV